MFGHELLIKVKFGGTFSGAPWLIPHLRHLRIPIPKTLGHTLYSAHLKPFGRKLLIKTHWAPRLVGKGSRQIGSVTSGQGLALRAGPVGLEHEAGLGRARAWRGPPLAQVDCVPLRARRRWAPRSGSGCGSACSRAPAFRLGSRLLPIAASGGRGVVAWPAFRLASCLGLPGAPPAVGGALGSRGRSGAARRDRARTVASTFPWTASAMRRRLRAVVRVGWHSTANSELVRTRGIRLSN